MPLQTVEIAIESCFLNLGDLLLKINYLLPVHRNVLNTRGSEVCI